MANKAGPGSPYSGQNLPATRLGVRMGKNKALQYNAA